MKKLCLNNNYSDNSSMREYISYKIMGELGLDVPECAYSHITVNGEEWGLYLAVEPVDEVFLAEHFADGKEVWQRKITGKSMATANDG